MNESNFVFPETFPVTANTQYVGYGSTFVAIKGKNVDGALYISEAIEKGAKRIVIEDGVFLSDDLLDLIRYREVDVLRCKNARNMLSELSIQASNYAWKKLVLIGVTGTKGKTTTVHLLAHIFRTAGYKTALLSTAQNIIDDEVFESHLTTEQPDYLHQFFSLCVNRGVTHCIVEVAAQALSMGRINGILFDGVVFTNFAREHLEFYENLDAYFEAKMCIFNHLKENGIAIINGDDKRLNLLPNRYLRFGQHEDFAVCGHSAIELKNPIVKGAIVYNKEIFDVRAPLYGPYNFYNVLAACGMSRLCGIDKEVCQNALITFKGTPGRFEWYSLKNGANCIIDQAHNPLSFEAILSTTRTMTDHLIVIFGAGGERDHGRRPLMGRCASSIADVVILTTDNPRSEDPADIVNEICNGIDSCDLKKVAVELDRASAIIYAHSISSDGSIILLLGKGNEAYQLVQGEKIPFSEKEIINRFM